MQHRPPTIARALTTLALVALCGTAGAREDSCLGEVCLVSTDSDTGVYFGARNSAHAPVTVTFEASRVRNLSATGKLPVRVVVPPGDSRRLVMFVQSNPYQGWELRGSHWSWSFGDARARHDDGYRYRMPYGGTEARPMTQGPGGRFSHGQRGARNAYDFGMPIGTPILAARSGVVVAV